MIIGFSGNTSKLFPKLFCTPPKHCAPIIQITCNRYVMYQFVRKGHIVPIALSKNAIATLSRYGWQFINTEHNDDCNILRHAPYAKSCVDLCKRSLEMHAPFILTPRALYNKLKRQQAL